MNRYEQARLLAIESLQGALIAHREGKIHDIEDNLDDYDKLIPRDDITPNSLLMITLEFWSGWSDSAVHGWLFYDPMTENDWPRLAKVLIDDLKADREVTNKEILDIFSVDTTPKGPSWISKMLEKIKGKQSNKAL